MRVLQVGGPADDVSPRLIEAFSRANQTRKSKEAARTYSQQLFKVLQQDPKPNTESKPILFMRHANGLEEFEVAKVRDKELREQLLPDLGFSKKFRDEL